MRQRHKLQHYAPLSEATVRGAVHEREAHAYIHSGYVDPGVSVSYLGSDHFAGGMLVAMPVARVLP
jgi:hypothetical protein